MYKISNYQDSYQGKISSKTATGYCWLVVIKCAQLPSDLLRYVRVNSVDLVVINSLKIT